MKIKVLKKALDKGSDKADPKMAIVAKLYELIVEANKGKQSGFQENFNKALWAVNHYFYDYTEEGANLKVDPSSFIGKEEETARKIFKNLK